VSEILDPVTPSFTDNIYRYSVYRRILDYYADGADAFDMRKPLRRDKQRKTVRPNGENIKVDPSEVW
jgi:N-terminal acetyltransferase B complex catalytic subunit